MDHLDSMKRQKMILVPYPAQGHVTPMLRLASFLHGHGFDPVLVTPEYIHTQIAKQVKAGDEILSMSIPDGLEEGATRDFFSLESAMENHMPIHLERLVHELDEDGGVACMVVDLLASWAIEVANRCGVPVAGFWPAMLPAFQLIAAIPDMLTKGLISEAGIPQQQGTLCLLPHEPTLSTGDLPWLIGPPSAIKGRFKFWTRTLNRSRTLTWLLVNSFPEEDKEKDHSIKPSHSYPIILPVGHLIKQVVCKSPSLWDEDMTCLEWLDKQNPDESVVYISFGSWVSPIGEEKVRNLATALASSGRKFLWVLKQAWRQGLPEGYIKRVSNQGKIVSWAPQMEVLKHKAVGCFLTHCGWNSTMEAIECMKPLLCYPVAGDQSLNCAYIVDAWKIGIRLNGFGEREVEEGLRSVMEDKEMAGRLRRLHERFIGEEAFSRGNSYLTAFLADLKKATNEAS